MTIPILINIVALNAEPELSIALVSGLRAASHALPVDICVAMLLTVSLSGTNIFQQTALAQKVFLLIHFLLFVVHGLFTVLQSSKVWRLALKALIECTFCVGQLLRLLKVVVLRVRKACILENALLLCLEQSLLLYVSSQANKWAKNGCNRLRDSLQLYFLLAARARHEAAKGDPKSRPPVLQELHHAVSVEDVTACEARTFLCAELRCIADSTQLFFIGPFKVSDTLCTSFIETRHTLAFICYTFARVTTISMSLTTEGFSRLLAFDLITRRYFKLDSHGFYKF